MLRPNEFPLRIVKRSRVPFDGDGWLFEIKHDGFRMLAIRDEEGARLFIRKTHDISPVHRLYGTSERGSAKRFVLDGEPVALGGDGRSLGYRCSPRAYRMTERRQKATWSW